MNKQDILKKLTSRKFWALLGGLVTSVMILYGFQDNQIAQVVASIGAFGTVITYIFIEGTIDINK